MDDLPNLESQSSKDRAWTTDEIRKHSSNWTLAGDVGLYNLLNEFSHHIISRTHEVENAVDSLVHQTKMTTAKINNVINDFHMLSNLQFVENRVYDEEISEPVTENKLIPEKTKEQREAEMLPKIVQAIELGLAVLDTAFDRINVNEISDSEDEDISSEGHTLLEPKDPYEHRPLPYIIGSEEFMKCEYAGLKDLIEEEVQSFSEESSISETEETSSDEGEPLPHDDDRFSDKQNDLVLTSDRISSYIRDRISSSDESELFGSEKEVNGFGSESSLEVKSKESNIQKSTLQVQPENEVKTRQSSVSSLQSKLKLPQVLPVPKLPEKKESDDFFTNEDLSDDESPFRKRTGLFTSDVRFDDEKDDDLFGGDLFSKSPSDDVKEVKKVGTPKAVSEKPKSVVQETKKPILFDNDEDSEDDIFNTLMKSKKPSTVKISNAGSQDSSEKADTSSSPSSAPSTKPSGNAFDFVTGSGNNDALFGDDSDGDDLFSSKKTQGKKIEFDSSESEDLFGSAGFTAPKESKVLSDTKPSLFEDKKLTDVKAEPEKPQIVKKNTKSIFEDSDSSDQEKPLPVKSPLSDPSRSKKGISLFDDDDDLEEDIFNKVSKKPEAPKKEEKSKTSKTNIFEDLGVPKESKPQKTAEKTKTLSLFDDSEEDSVSTVSSVPKPPQNNASSLFDDDSFDLFAPKKSEKSQPMRVESSEPVSIPKPDVSETKDVVDGIMSSKLHKQEVDVLKPKDDVENVKSPKVSSAAVDAITDAQVGFDKPVDSSNVLNVINKGRIKVTTKRRKPTRQGRLAALENSEKEAEADSKAVAAKPDPAVLDEESDSLFSSTKPPIKPEIPKLDHKAQEKKKMNIMSALMSEVATSKVLKRAAEKEEEDEDDDVDIFSESAKKGRSKNSFSFRPPEENGIASVFPIEKTEDKVDSGLSKSDSFEDDFFAEPAFQNFRSSISQQESSVLNLDDDEDDDDDLFSAIKKNVLPKPKAESAEPNDLFADDTDIFAHVQKEKYEMFPNQIYDDEDDDDIFSNVNSSSNKLPNKTGNSTTVKKVETQQVNAFDDPLSGLLGD